jgi:methylmalonyl-CoA mutase C-terminal domain/subunit
MVVEAALQEDVDVIGLSILSGAHMSLMLRIMELMRENDLADIPVFLGGIIPNDDVPTLLEIGITGVFGPGTSTKTIISTIQETVSGARAN